MVSIHFRPFHDMIMNVDDLYSWSNSHDTNLNLLIPSAKFIASLSNFHRSYMSAEPDMDRKVGYITLEFCAIS
ncbi:hypothetical protein DPMN_150723 [Dreissena polymorpha]|uniref:Uncharacterized protein n=1 Tax=Dreissena polymorpha TaxID=45954 RepID=A0A9D4J691_DREPO|nr:hypothetical protein DPMN_150723 [Dreissena polymorpha]